jgi:hypothetical protein
MFFLTLFWEAHAQATLAALATLAESDVIYRTAENLSCAGAF